MKIVADENIPCVGEAFGSWGTVQRVPGASIDAVTVRDAEILLVRSVTAVNEGLLGGSTVRLVASATSGTDHVDLAYLKRAGIGFVDAPGSNADSVAEYVLATLAALQSRLPDSLDALSIGIIGVGHVGSRLAGLCRALGMHAVLNDPPRARAEGANFRTFEEACACDIVTAHVPLVRSGPDPTVALFDDRAFDGFRPGAVFVNTSRGDVVDEAALKRAISAGRLGAVALDVWHDEPRIDPTLLEMVDLGTPHIAGYSVEAKLRGTQMIHDGLADRLESNSRWDYRNHLPPPPPCIRVDRNANPLDVFRAAYDPRNDDAALRDAINRDGADGFNRLRRTYPPRREFSAYRAVVAGGALQAAMLQSLGFGA